MKSATEALKWLGQNKLVAWLKEASSYEPTQFGKACLGSGLDPEIALHVYEASAPPNCILSISHAAATLDVGQD